MDAIANICGWILARIWSIDFHLYLYMKKIILQSAYVIQAKLHEVELYNCITPPIQPNPYFVQIIPVM